MIRSRLVVRIFSRVVLLMGMCIAMGAFAAAAFAAPADNAMVRVVHASPDAGTVDVFVDGNALLTNFQFGTVTDYVTVPAGSHNIQVAPAGKGASAAVITQSVTVSAGVPYTVAAIGTKDSGFSLQAFVDNNSLTANQAKVRVYHLSPNAGPVDVAAGGNKVISGLTYKQASDYLMVPAGSYTFNVTATQANATVPVPATLKAGVVTSVFAVGLYNGNPALKFVAANANGLPNWPNTGSDPTVSTSTTTSTLRWAVAAMVVFLLGTGVVVVRLRRK